MNNTWRHYLKALQSMVADSEIYTRDPFTVMVITADPERMSSGKVSGPPWLLKAVGVSKRNRYARTKDDPDAVLGSRIATERAYKDLYNQTISVHKEAMDLYTNSSTLCKNMSEAAFSIGEVAKAFNNAVMADKTKAAEL